MLSLVKCHLIWIRREKYAQIQLCLQMETVLNKFVLDFDPQVMEVLWYYRLNFFFLIGNGLLLASSFSLHRVVWIIVMFLSAIWTLILMAPFTAEDPLDVMLNSPIHYNGETNSSTLMAWAWVNFIFWVNCSGYSGRIVPVLKVNGILTYCIKCNYTVAVFM